MTEMQQYQKDTTRSLSSQNHLASVNRAVLLDTLKTMADAGQKLDFLKKLIFYGKPVPAEYQSTEPWDIKFPMHMLHSLIGMIGEAGELAEAMYTAIDQDTSLDDTNIIEEIGDVMWYIALGLNTLNTTFEDVARININKLKKRYPEKFTTENALNRDLAGERALLEAETGC